MSICITCGLFDDFNTKMTEYNHDFFNTMAPHLSKLMEGVAFVWIVYMVFRAVLGKEIDLEDTIYQIVYFTITIAILKGGGTLWWTLFDMIVSIGIKSATIAFSIGGASSSADGLNGLLEAAEKTVRDHMGETISGMLIDISILALLQALASLLLAGVYLYLAWKMIRNIFSGYVKMFSVGLLSPFIIALTAFPATRRTLTIAIKILVSAGFQLILAGGITGLIGAIMSGLASKLPEKDGMVTEEAAEFLLSGNYFMLVIIGLMLSLIYDEIIAVAAQLVEVVDNQVKLPNFPKPTLPGGSKKK